MSRFAVAFLAATLGGSVSPAVFAGAPLPELALVVDLPSYQSSLVNTGVIPVTIDGYQIESSSGALDPVGWVSLADAAGPDIVAALGPGADQFEEVGIVDPFALAEFSILGSATWQPGQSWSIGRPFDTNAEFVFDTTFEYLVVGESATFQGFVIYRQVPEPAAGALLAVLVVGVVVANIRHYR